MTGVEILAVEKIVTTVSYNWWLAGIVFLVVMIIGGIIGFFTSNSIMKSEGILIGLCIGALTGIFFWGAACVMSAEPISYRNQYKVTIDDSVSLNDFNEKYEVIDQEGNVYIVRERE